MAFGTSQEITASWCTLLLVSMALGFGMKTNSQHVCAEAERHGNHQHVRFASLFRVDGVCENEQSAARMRLLKQSDTAVRIVDNVLSPRECDALISAAEREGLSRPEAFNASARSCERLHTVDSDLSTEMLERLRPFLPEVVCIDGARWKLGRFTHHWRYVKYQHGGHFIPHYDGSKLLPWHEMSVFTVQIYLNDNFNGGETRFYTDFQPQRFASHTIDYGHVTHFDPPNPPTHSVAPKTGSVLIFNHANESILHDGAGVEDGIKYILRGDLLYSAIQEDIPILQNPTFAPEMRSWCPKTAAKFGTRTFIGQVWWCECAVDGHGSGCDGLGLEAPATDEENVSDSSRMDVMLISGKRASGKDFVGTLLEADMSGIGIGVHRTALGDVNKRAYAEKAGIDYHRLLTDRAFKEQHRIAMVAHHTERNRQDPEWCNKLIFQRAVASGANVMLVTDLRTRQDLRWFESKAREQGGSAVVLRVDAGNQTRAARGWDEDPTKDSLVTEVDLDGFEGWTARVANDDDSEQGAAMLREWIRNTVMPRLPAAHSRGWRGASC